MSTDASAAIAELADEVKVLTMAVVDAADGGQATRLRHILRARRAELAALRKAARP